ncbi:MAG: DedA family protein [Rhodospirillales bacterium]|nr:DedA family protein [Rhodospirillales bacterium]
MNFEQLAIEYGAYIYALIFIWTFFEGETFVIFAGFAAHQGSLDWTAVFLTAWFGSFCGDQTYFWIGRRWGQDILLRFPRWRPGVDAGLEFLRTYNTWFILSFRFIYGVRNFASFAMGLSGLDPLRFAALNFIAAFVWALSFAGFGYLFGQALQSMLGEFAHTFGLIMLGIFALSVGVFIFVRKRHLRRMARAKRLSAAGAPPLAVQSERSGSSV